MTELLLKDVKGKVRWFNQKKGYGFIEIANEDGSQQDVFLHYSQLQMNGYKTVDMDANVLFNLVKNERGSLEAYEVNVCAQNKKKESIK